MIQNYLLLDAEEPNSGAFFCQAQVVTCLILVAHLALQVNLTEIMGKLNCYFCAFDLFAARQGRILSQKGKIRTPRTKLRKKGFILFRAKLYKLIEGLKQ